MNANPEAQQHPRLFSAQHPASERADPDPGRVLDGTPSAVIESQFESDDGNISIGTWTCTPGRWRVSYAETEYCRILEGAGEIVSDDGPIMTIAAGDEFVIPAGFQGEWIVTERMTKRYVVML